MGRPIVYWSEVREPAVRLVSEYGGSTVLSGRRSVRWPRSSGVRLRRLPKWVPEAERDQGVGAGLSSSGRGRLRALEREVRELRRANEILGKASAYFAQAEVFDRGARR